MNKITHLFALIDGDNITSYTFSVTVDLHDDNNITAALYKVLQHCDLYHKNIILSILEDFDEQYGWRSPNDQPIQGHKCTFYGIELMPTPINL